MKSDFVTSNDYINILISKKITLHLSLLSNFMSIIKKIIKTI